MKLKITKGKIIIFSVVVIILIIVISFLLTFIIRNNIIANQIFNSLDSQNQVAISYSSGNNIFLSNKIYNKLKEEKVDLIIVNEKYIAKIKNENITKNINLNVNIKNNELYTYIKVSGAILDDLKIKNNMDNIYWLSEYYNNETEEVYVANDIKMDEAGYYDLKLIENAREYILKYIELDVENLNIEELKVNKRENIKLDFGINEECYTYNSYLVEAEDKEAINVDENNNLTINKVGEYKIILKNSKASKELKLIVEQPVEKIELSKSTIEIVIGRSSKIDVSISPDDATNKEIKFSSSDENIAKVDNDGNIVAVAVGNCQVTASTLSEPVISATVQVQVIEKPVLQLPNIGAQVPGITYINGILLVNKTHPIPQDYAPGLLQIAYNAFQELRSAALQEGYDIQLLSGYRSYETQRNLYNNYVATYGQAEADTFSARPGTSEHQTGLAMDVGWIDDAYADTPSGKWLAANCYKYGFIIRYPKDKENITGYKYEPWHIRYLGKDIAKDVYDSGLCLEEYLGVN